MTYYTMGAAARAISFWDKVPKWINKMVIQHFNSIGLALLALPMTACGFGLFFQGHTDTMWIVFATALALAMSSGLVANYLER